MILSNSISVSNEITCQAKLLVSQKNWLSDQGIVGEYRPPQSLDLDLNSVVKKISGRVLVGYHLKFPVKKCTNYHLLLIEDLCTELRMDIMK